jgi:hypothetical protein
MFNGVILTAVLIAVVMNPKGLLTKGKDHSWREVVFLVCLVGILTMDAGSVALCLSDFFS